MTTKMEELATKAKALKMNGVHLFKSEESLEAKINEVESAKKLKEEARAKRKLLIPEDPTRKKAPMMTIDGIDNDARKELIDRLEKEDPECKYVFRHATITDDELRAQGYERTGQVLKNDIVCRTQRIGWENVVEAKREAQYKSMQSIDGGEGNIDSFEERARKPKE
jgi:hypothetical protein